MSRAEASEIRHAHCTRDQQLRDVLQVLEKQGDYTEQYCIESHIVDDFAEKVVVSALSNAPTSTTGQGQSGCRLVFHSSIHTRG